jgi:hypothetical protein
MGRLLFRLVKSRLPQGLKPNATSPHFGNPHHVWRDLCSPTRHLQEPARIFGARGKGGDLRELTFLTNNLIADAGHFQ